MNRSIVNPFQKLTHSKLFTTIVWVYSSILSGVFFLSRFFHQKVGLFAFSEQSRVANSDGIFVVKKVKAQQSQTIRKITASPIFISVSLPYFPTSKNIFSLSFRSILPKKIPRIKLFTTISNPKGIPIYSSLKASLLK